MKSCDVREATHIKTRDGRIEQIAGKWGIDSEGHFAKPSEGGFGCVTVHGERVSMWDAMAYYRDGG
jgi:hypothetical protein